MMNSRWMPLLSLGATVLMGCLAEVGTAYGLPVTTDLTTWNETYLDSRTDKVTVTVTHEGVGRYATTVVRFDWIGGNSGIDAVGLEKISWNNSAKIINCADGWTCGGKGQMDGFGLFKTTASNEGGDDLSATFVLKGKVRNFGSNGKGAKFAAYVNYGDGCSGFVSNAKARFGGKVSNGCGSLSERISETNRLPSNDVPEPGSLMLLAAGLAGIGISRRKLN